MMFWSGNRAAGGVRFPAPSAWSTITYAKVSRPLVTSLTPANVSDDKVVVIRANETTFARIPPGESPWETRVRIIGSDVTDEELAARAAAAKAPRPAVAASFVDPPQLHFLPLLQNPPPLPLPFMPTVDIPTTFAAASMLPIFTEWPVTTAAATIPGRRPILPKLPMIEEPIPISSDPLTFPDPDAFPEPISIPDPSISDPGRFTEPIEFPEPITPPELIVFTDAPAKPPATTPDIIELILEPVKLPEPVGTPAEPVPEPVITPKPVPEPEPEPEPKPVTVPISEPDPEPKPVAAPEAVAVSEPVKLPEPEPVPVPVSAPKPKLIVAPKPGADSELIILKRKEVSPVPQPTDATPAKVPKVPKLIIKKVPRAPIVVRTVPTRLSDVTAPANRPEPRQRQQRAEAGTAASEPKKHKKIPKIVVPATITAKRKTAEGVPDEEFGNDLLKKLADLCSDRHTDVSDIRIHFSCQKFRTARGTYNALAKIPNLKIVMGAQMLTEKCRCHEKPKFDEINYQPRTAANTHIETGPYEVTVRSRASRELLAAARVCQDVAKRTGIKCEFSLSTIRYTCS
ncbi:m117 protein [Murid betaherpesvirus 1]|nr:m117 protein [Murid betaherpesvirus 1]